MILNKQKLLQQLQQKLEQRLTHLQNDATDLHSSLANESKSSAGDKHNTARAMIHLEQEKMGEQIQQAKQHLQRIQQIRNTTPSSEISFGSYVETKSGNFLLGVGIGKVHVDHHELFCISMESPIAQQLLSKKKGESFRFMKQEVTIKNVF